MTGIALVRAASRPSGGPCDEKYYERSRSPRAAAGHATFNDYLSLSISLSLSSFRRLYDPRGLGETVPAGSRRVGTKRVMVGDDGYYSAILHSALPPRVYRRFFFSFSFFLSRVHLDTTITRFGPAKPIQGRRKNRARSFRTTSSSNTGCLAETWHDSSRWKHAFHRHVFTRHPA